MRSWIHARCKTRSTCKYLMETAKQKGNNNANK